MDTAANTNCSVILNMAEGIEQSSAGNHCGGMQRVMPPT